MFRFLLDPMRNRMISGGSKANYRQIETNGFQIEPSEQAARTVMELHQLLELYAPLWYTEELRDNIESTLLVLGKVSKVTRAQAADGSKDPMPSFVSE